MPDRNLAVDATSPSFSGLAGYYAGKHIIPTIGFDAEGKPVAGYGPDLASSIEDYRKNGGRT